MATSCTYSIVFANSDAVYDVNLTGARPRGVPEKAALTFLSVVDVDRIPLHLVVGSPCPVGTSSLETERFFSSILLQDPQASPSPHRQPWWESVRATSPLGILVALNGTAEERGGPALSKTTEIVFYASRQDALSGRPPTPPQDPHESAEAGLTTKHGFAVYALPLSSDLYHAALRPSPPPSTDLSPVNDGEVEGIMLPPLVLPPADVIHEPLVRKRKDVNDTFDEAAERRKKARRRGGEGVAAAAAANSAITLPSLKHRRSESAASDQGVPLQSRPLSRSPSITSLRPATARATSIPQHRSSLSLVQSAVDPAEGTTCDSKNKDLISRIVMAGMRLYGLSQSKSRKSRAGSGTASPAIDITFDDLYDARRNDEEYKLVYHQVFKGVCFAFRTHMSSVALQPHTEALRDTVDKLLALYCNNPLETGLPGWSDELTPGGRKAFATGARPD